MKTMKLSSVLLILILSALAPACVTVAPQRVEAQPAPRRVVVQVGAEEQPFYDDLSPYGEWVYVSGPGWVWCPSQAEAEWRPYQLGHWVLTDYGWTWASDESFGWAVYHYGRWHSDPAYGWVWVPGTEWGPAWVAWHQGGDWIGWAPLPWQVRWRAGIGLDWGSVRIDVALAPSSWYFVRTRYLVDPGLRFRIAPPAQNITLIQMTQHVTNYTYVDNRIVDQSIRADFVGRAVGRPIRRYPLREAESPEMSSGGGVRDGEFVVYRPGAGRGARSQRRGLPPGQEKRMEPFDRSAPPIQEHTAVPQERGATTRDGARGPKGPRPSRLDRGARGDDQETDQDLPPAARGRTPTSSSPGDERGAHRPGERDRNTPTQSEDRGVRGPESDRTPPPSSNAGSMDSKPDTSRGQTDRRGSKASDKDKGNPSADRDKSKSASDRGKGHGNKKHEDTGKSGKPKTENTADNPATEDKE